MQLRTTLLILSARTILFILVFCLPIVGCSQEKRHQFDVVIYGGTSAGFVAAIQVAKEGKRVALLEPSEHIGGMNVEGLGGTDIDNHAEFQNSPAVGGLALEFYRRIAAEYGRLNEFEKVLKEKGKNSWLWKFEPHVAEKVIMEWLSEYPITTIRNTRISESDGAVRKTGSRITSIRMENGEVFEATIFIDATIEGDLMHFAGVSNIIGRESNSVYNETFNGNRPETTHALFQVPVDPYRIAGDSSSGLIATIQDEELGIEGVGDRRIQAYCFRMCLTKDQNNLIPFSKPDNYTRDTYEIYLRYLGGGGKLYTPYSGIPNGKTDLGAWHDLSHNLYGLNHNYPGGSYEERAEILKYHRDFTQGLFYFLANDPEVGQLDSELQATWSKWGLAKDEFVDNGGWPRMFYVRDGRRMVSDYVINEHHIKKEGGITVDDPVAVAFWPPDVHSVRRIVKNGKAFNEGFVFGGDWWKPFGISYRALVPKQTECTNLLVPSCLSSSHIAYGAIRIEFTFMSLGQAVASAAVLAIDGNLSVQDVPYEAIKNKLLSDNQIISL